MSIYVKSIEATGIHGRFDIRQDFQDGINIIFGVNGAGKTTLLHILANSLSGDFERLKYLQFRKISILLSNKKKLNILSKKEDDKVVIEARLGRKKIFPTTKADQLSLEEKEYLIYKSRLAHRKELTASDNEALNDLLRARRLQKERDPVVPVAYFPAFRTMIEAWVAAATKRENEPVARRYRGESWKDLATERARDWFGGFTPMVNFPSLVDIEEQLANEIENARLNVWRTDQTLLSDSFFNIFASLTKTKSTGLKADNLLVEIQELFKKLEQSPLRAESRIDYPKLREQIAHLTIGGNTDPTALRVLKIYSDTLESTLTVQKESFAGIQKYLASVNEFLEGKSLVFKQDVKLPRRRQSIQIQFDDETFIDGLRALSSGERQIMTLVYAATHMSQQEIVLIDEPEISLHVDWQRMLIKRMAEQMGKRQIIACTHSPVIGADHLDKVKELSLSVTKVKSLPVIEEEDEEDIPF